MKRFKVKSYCGILLLALAMISMLISCSMPQASADKQESAENKTANSLNVPLMSGSEGSIDYGLCNLICRWTPTGQLAYLIYDPDYGTVVIRPWNNYSDMLNHAWQWHAYVKNGKIAFHNDKFSSFSEVDLEQLGGSGYGSWLGAYTDGGMDDNEPGYYINPSLYLRPNSEYFTQENQQTINGHTYANLTQTYPGFSGKYFINCENWYNYGYPVISNTYRNTDYYYNSGWTGWWSAQWWISWYSDNDD